MAQDASQEGKLAMPQLIYVARIIGTIVSGPMLLVGIIWIFQGLNLLPGSVMTGHIQWAVFGVILALAGGALVYGLNRRQP
jgi:hypothetical protein